MEFSAHYKSGRTIVAEIENPVRSWDGVWDPAKTLAAAVGVFALLEG